MKIEEGCTEISAEVTHEAMDNPSCHRRTVGGDRQLEVQASERNSGNSDQVWGYGRIIIDEICLLLTYLQRLASQG